MTFDDDDSVVHQHPHGDDKRAKADPLHLDSENSHEEHGCKHCQAQSRAHNQTSPPAHGQHQRSDHDCNRLEQTDKEACDSLVHHLVLLVDRDQFGACGQRVGQVCQPRLDGPAHLDDIAIGQCRNAERESPDTVLTDDLAGLFSLVPGHPRDIVDSGLSDLPRRAQTKRLDPFDRYVARRDRQGDPRPVGCHLTIGKNLIFAGDDPDQLIGRSTQTFQPGGVDGQRYFFLDQALNLDPRHAVDRDQPPPQHTRQIALFGRGQTLGGHGIKQSEHIAEIIVDDRVAGACGQFATNITDPAPHFVPDLRDLVRPVTIDNLDRDLCHTRHRLRLDTVKLPHLLESRLDDIGNLFFHLLCGGAGIGHEHQCGLEREAGIFQPPDIRQAP